MDGPEDEDRFESFFSETLESVFWFENFLVGVLEILTLRPWVLFLVLSVFDLSDACDFLCDAWEMESPSLGTRSKYVIFFCEVRRATELLDLTLLFLSEARDFSVPILVLPAFRVCFFYGLEGLVWSGDFFCWGDLELTGVGS